jgi:hypothetical protein
MDNQRGWYGVIIVVAVLCLLSCDGGALSSLLPDENGNAVREGLEQLIPVPGRQEYPRYGETQMKQELTVIAVYSTGLTEQVPVTAIEFPGLNFEALGQKTVVLTYKGRAATFTVTVVQGLASDTPGTGGNGNGLDIQIGWATQ